MVKTNREKTSTTMQRETERDEGRMTESRARAVRELSRAARLEQAGMTLIEIMIVLAILALIMGFLVGPRVMTSFKEARIKSAKMEVKDLAYNAYARWQADHEDETCPSSLEDLKKYTNKAKFKDPWGSKYVMRCGDNAPEGVEFGVSSPGPDKKEGTDDDVRSWDDR